MEKLWEILEGMQGQIAAEIRVMLGESPYPQQIFDAAQQARRIEAMKKCAAESTSDVERHESWMAMHREAGWAWGPEFDPSRKLHPNLLPWSELPESVKSKAKIFDIVAKTARKLEIELLKGD
jgi:hypothetical protein